MTVLFLELLKKVRAAGKKNLKIETLCVI